MHLFDIRFILLTEHKDAQQLTVVVEAGLHLILYPDIIDHLYGVEVVDLRQVRELGLEEGVDMHVLLHQLIAITTAQFAGLRTGILDDTGLVEQEDGGILAVEDRPVTQGALVFELFQAVGCCHAATRRGSR